MSRITAVSAVILLTAGIGGCGRRPASDQAARVADSVPAAATAAPMPVIEVSAVDYAYQVADTVAAGAVTVRLHNTGKELHHVQLIRLPEGKTLADLAKAGPVPPSWAILEGGPNASVPGKVSEASLVLSPGQYAIVCVIPSPDGMPHLMKGMAKSLTVVPGSSQATLPAGDIGVKLSDYAFEVSGSLSAGRHQVKVETTTDQPHEVLFVRLEPGKTGEEFARWAEKPNGPPPGLPIGGATAISRGEVNLVDIDLTPGDYALVCFVPDAKDGKPHYRHGMIKQFKVT